MKFAAEKKEPLLDLIVRKLAYHSKTKARNFIKSGSVMVAGECVFVPSTEVLPGQEVETGPTVKKRAIADVSTIEVLFEDKFIIAANKPCKILSSKVDRTGSLSFTDEVDQYVKRKSANQGSVYPINYLSKDMSGIMVFAKDKEIVPTLKKNWKESFKSYYAVVEGRFPEKQLTYSFEIKENEKGKMVVQEKNSKYAKLATIHIEVIEEYKRPFTAIEIRPDSFVKDQERCLLKKAGFPIVGDTEYSGHSNRIKRMAMHNWKMTLRHPVLKVNVNLTAELPKRLLDF